MICLATKLSMENNVIFLLQSLQYVILENLLKRRPFPEAVAKSPCKYRIPSTCSKIAAREP